MQHCSIDIWFVPKLLLYNFSVAKLKKTTQKVFFCCNALGNTAESVDVSCGTHYIHFVQGGKQTYFCCHRKPQCFLWMLIHQIHRGLLNSHHPFLKSSHYLPKSIELKLGGISNGSRPLKVVFTGWVLVFIWSFKVEIWQQLAAQIKHQI